MMTDAVSVLSSRSSSSTLALSSIGSMTLLKERNHMQTAVTIKAVGTTKRCIAGADVPTNRAEDVEVDNEGPCYSLIVERSRHV